MISRVLASVMFLASIVPLSAAAEDSLVRFEGGFGASPVARDLSPNMALGSVTPAFYSWVIKDLSVKVKLDGRISVVGRGLLNGGGPNIGTNRGMGQVPITVFASLFCLQGSTYQEFSTHPPVSVDPNGDFEIEGLLAAVPPAPCDSPVLLIRNGNQPQFGQWHAAGIPKR